MLAFTMQFSKHERTPTHTTTKPPQTPPLRTTQGTESWMRYDGKTGPHAQTHPTNQARRALRRPEDNQHQTKKQPGARFLRTQQCAPPSPADPSDGFPEPTKTRWAVLTSGINQEESNSQCSTNEQPTRRTFACGMSHGPHTPRTNPSVCGQCSLERR
jgi:hypothetical protein